MLELGEWNETLTPLSLKSWRSLSGRGLGPVVVKLLPSVVSPVMRGVWSESTSIDLTWPALTRSRRAGMYWFWFDLPPRRSPDGRKAFSPMPPSTQPIGRDQLH